MRRLSAANPSFRRKKPPPPDPPQESRFYQRKTVKLTGLFAARYFIMRRIEKNAARPSLRGADGVMIKRLSREAGSPHPFPKTLRRPDICRLLQKKQQHRPRLVEKNGWHNYNAAFLRKEFPASLPKNASAAGHLPPFYRKSSNAARASLRGADGVIRKRLSREAGSPHPFPKTLRRPDICRLLQKKQQRRPHLVERGGRRNDKAAFLRKGGSGENSSFLLKGRVFPRKNLPSHFFPLFSFSSTAWVSAPWRRRIFSTRMRENPLTSAPSMTMLGIAESSFDSGARTLRVASRA